MSQDRPAMGDALRTLARFSAPARRALLTSTVLAVVATLVELVPLLALALAAETLIAGDATPARLGWLSAIALVGGAVRIGLWGTAMVVSHVGAYAQLHALRTGLADRLTHLPLGWFTHRHGGEVQRVLVDDVQKMELFVAHSFPETVSAITTWLVVSVGLAILDIRLALAAAVPLALGYAVLHVGTRRTASNIAANAAAAAGLRRLVLEHLAMSAERRLFAQPGWRPPVHEAIDTQAETMRGWLGRFAPYGSAYMTIVVASVVGIVPVGLILLDSGAVDVSVVTVFLLLGLGYGTPLVKLRRTWYQLAAIGHAGSVVEGVLDAAVLPDSGVRHDLEDQTLAVTGVRFAYEERTVVEDISFTAAPGTVTALVGPSGAGKSTIARLIARFWDVDGGAITVGGVDVRDLAVDQLSELIGVVVQDTFLFTDTVAANLRRARPGATDAELRDACAAARVLDVVDALPDGLHTVVGRGGRHLSGGQAQRLSIARAMLRDAPIVVLDEATAFVDPDAEAEIQAALSALAAGRTLIVIAHRLPTIVGASQILVIEDGRIAQRGRHEDLRGLPGPYARLWDDWEAAADSGLGRAAAVEARP